MNTSIRWRGVLAGAVSVAVMAGGAAWTSGALAAGTAKAAAGKADSGTSYAAEDVNCGKDVCVAGFTYDKLFGQTAITYVIKVGAGKPGTFKVTAKPVVMYTKTGELTGTGTATLAIAASGVETIPAGKLDLNKGTGGQAGHTLMGTFTGVGSTKTGLFKFSYKGTYK
jgi:hypothetical protein